MSRTSWNRGKRKHPEAERRHIAARYELGVRHRVKQILADHGIGKETLHAYVREFQGRI